LLPDHEPLLPDHEPLLPAHEPLLPVYPRLIPIPMNIVDSIRCKIRKHRDIIAVISAIKNRDTLNLIRESKISGAKFVDKKRCSM
jgi:hypothetical protein